MSAELLRKVGEALYGPRWQSELARDLEMSDRHVRRLAAGSAELTAGMRIDLMRLCAERAAELDDLVERLKSAG